MNRLGVLALLFCLLIQACSSADPVNPSPQDSNGTGSVVFVAQNVTAALMMTALFDGQLVRDDTGCLRLATNDAPFVIWPKDFTLVERGPVKVVRDASGRDVGPIGGRFRLSGGSLDTLHAGVPVSAQDRNRALQACPGRYWLVGSVVQ